MAVLKRFKKKLLGVGKRWAKDILLSWYFPRVYQKAAQQRVVPGKTIFLDNKESELPESFQVLYDRLSLVPQLSLSFMTLQETRVRFMLYVRNCIAFIQALATAQYVFINDASNIISCLPLRPETKVVQLWHGCGAFKKWGMSTADLKFGGTREDLLRHPFYKNLSLVTVSSPEVIWAYEEAMVLEDQPGTVQPTGVSRTDVFFDEKYIRQSRRDVYDVVPEARNKKILVYAPTFRGRVAKAQAPDQLDIPAMKTALGDEYVLLIKHHPFVKKPPIIEAAYADFAFDVSKTLPINKLLCCADVVISDYSSLVFEYALFEKPMVFFAYDKADYDDWRGFYYDYETLTPGPVFTDTEEIIDYIEHLDERFDKQEVVDFKEKFMAKCDGHATDRIIEQVLGPEVLHEIQARETVQDATPLVSVVIPVYNAERQLRECLTCVTLQTLDQIEIICVDDGSTDGSAAILQEFVSKDSRMVVVHQQNEYAGVARNKGIDLARGKYLVFWDADDYFELDALEKLYNQCEADAADIAVCGARQDFVDTGVVVHGSMYLVKKYIPEIVPFNRLSNEEYILNFTTMVVWNKMFRRDFVLAKGLEFAHSRSNNDVKFVVCALCEAERITLVREDLVTYRRDQGTALTNNLDTRALDIVKTWIATREELLQRDVCPQTSFVNRAAASMVYMLRNLTSYKAYEEVAAYLQKEGMQQLGFDVALINSSWQRDFFATLENGTIQEALMLLMHESYQQQITSQAKNLAKQAKQAKEIKKLKKAAEKAE